MPDTRAIVTISGATPTTVKDLNDGTNYQWERGSFQVKPGPRKTSLAASPRRYIGAYSTGEAHDNGQVTGTMLIAGANAEAVKANLESALGFLENSTLRYYFRWTPEGVTNSTYYEIRGPATWELTYDWTRLVNGKAMYVNVSIPIEPVGRGLVAANALASSTLPLYYTGLAAVPGTLPAQVDVSLRFSGGALAPIWMLIAWAQRPSAPQASSYAPFGLIQFDAASTIPYGPQTPTTTGADATYTGGTGMKFTTAGAGQGGVAIPLDPGTMTPDAFTPNTIDIECWARLRVPSTVVTPRVVLHAGNNNGVNFGNQTYSHEFGAAGKPIVVPTSSQFRLVRLGTITLPTDTGQKYNIHATISWGVGSTGDFGWDYMVMVPSRQRACSMTGINPTDPSYAKYIIGTVDTTKTIRSDLSGSVASAAGVAWYDTGLGGAPIEFPPGNVDVMLLPSTTIPDAPTPSADAHQISHLTVTGDFNVTPRYALLR